MNQFMQNLPQNPRFQSLPAWLQESIMQSGVEFSSDEELRSFASGIQDGKNSRA